MVRNLKFRRIRPIGLCGVESDQEVGPGRRYLTPGDFAELRK